MRFLRNPVSLQSVYFRCSWFLLEQKNLGICLQKVCKYQYDEMCSTIILRLRWFLYADSSIFFTLETMYVENQLSDKLTSFLLRNTSNEHISFFVHPIKTNRKAYVCVCYIFKIGDATSTQICFPVSAHALKWESKFVCL